MDQYMSRKEEREHLKAKVRKLMKDIEPHMWNNGCGCCSSQDLEEDPTWIELEQLVAEDTDEMV